MSNVANQHAVSAVSNPESKQTTVLEMARQIEVESCRIAQVDSSVEDRRKFAQLIRSSADFYLSSLKK
jgi:hypothetical protein